jgi:CRP/FNR family cyclic AMP-dependent transcriptional regulator
MTRTRTDFRKVALKRIPLLKDASESSIKKLDREAVRKNYSSGESIILRSSRDIDVYILLSGQARVAIFSSNGKVVGFRKINPGDLFGEFAAIDGQERSATVEAVKASSALVISAALFRELMEKDSAFLNTVLKHLVNLLRSMTARVVEFSTLAVKNRIHNELLRLAKAPADGLGPHQITPAPKHVEIAAQISTHREAVSREISRLKRLGILERRGRSLIVNDYARLESMVHDASGECLLLESDKAQS